jgi:hypothetical protein
MKRHSTIMALGAVLLGACSGSGGIAASGGTDTDPTAGATTGDTLATTTTTGDTTGGTTATMSTTLTDSSDPTTQSASDSTGEGPNYWDDGVCNGVNTPSSSNCMDLDYAGTCTDDGKVIYCDNNQMYCIDCEGSSNVCEWVDANSWFDCVAPTVGTTTDTSTSTSTSTSG